MSLPMADDLTNPPMTNDQVTNDLITRLITDN
jgi:hypothetical protein